MSGRSQDREHDLKDGQVSDYLDVARTHGYDGVLTISNQITATSDESPGSLDGRKLKRVSLWHLSWWKILTEALVQTRNREIKDPDQAWILQELIHYLSSESSGATGFEDMGSNWVDVRNAVAGSTLRANDAGAKDVVERWEQFTQYLCMNLSQELGRIVTAPRPRKQSTPDRLAEVSRALTESGVLLRSTLRIPDAVGDIEIRADLRAGQTSITVALGAPTDRKTKARISWLLRQLADAADDLKIEAVYPSARQTIPATLGQAREDPAASISGRHRARGQDLCADTHPAHGSKTRTGPRFVRKRDHRTNGHVL